MTPYNYHIHQLEMAMGNSVLYTKTDLVNMRHRVYQHMLATRGWKYRAFLRYLRIFKYVAMAPRRGTFLESYYVLMRYIDDIVDGDVSLPHGYKSEIQFIRDKIEFSTTLSDPKDEVDYLMLFCFETADAFGEDFTQETTDILNSLLFDAERRNSWKVFPRSVLMHHFHLLDIRGTIKATLKVFNEDPEKFTFLEPLGIACRYHYDIEDISADLLAGYVNIPLEDFEPFGIHPNDLRDADSPPIRAWLCHRANEGLRLLERHHQMLPEGKFSWLARATFPPVYENPARKVFRRTIRTYGSQPIVSGP